MLIFYVVSKWLKDTRGEPSYLCKRAAWCSTCPRGAKARLTLAHPASQRRGSWRPSVTQNDCRKYSLPLTINSSMKMSIYSFSKHPFMQTDFAAHRPGSNEWPCSGWINTPFSDIILFVRLLGTKARYAVFYLNRFAFLLWLYDHYKEEKKTQQDYIFKNYFLLVRTT